MRPVALTARMRRILIGLFLVGGVAVGLATVACAFGDSNPSSSAGESGPRSLLEQQALEWTAQLRTDPSKAVCLLYIPSIDLEMPVWEMTDESILDRGLGHWPETFLPGRRGHMVISGHRSTFGSPLLRLDELELGDRIGLVLPYVVAEYEVTRVLVVGPTDTEVVLPRGLEELSLVTCHPPGSAESMLVVTAGAVLFHK